MANMERAHDYIERGSEQHAQLLRLRKEMEGDLVTQDGWALDDVESFGPGATEAYLKSVLAQRVRDLTGQHPKLQSRDPLKPNYAQPMWVPSEQPITGIV